MHIANPSAKIIHKIVMSDVSDFFAPCKPPSYFHYIEDYMKKQEVYSSVLTLGIKVSSSLFLVYGSVPLI